MSKASWDLDRVASLLEQKDWCQGSSTKDGAICIAQAFGQLDLMKSDAYGALVEYTGCRLLFQWNDEPGRTKEEVVSIVRACALREREKGK